MKVALSRWARGKPAFPKMRQRDCMYVLIVKYFDSSIPEIPPSPRTHTLSNSNPLCHIFLFIFWGQRSLNWMGNKGVIPIIVRIKSFHSYRWVCCHKLHIFFQQSYKVNRNNRPSSETSMNNDQLKCSAKSIMQSLKYSDFLRFSKLWIYQIIE